MPLEFIKGGKGYVNLSSIIVMADGSTYLVSHTCFYEVRLTSCPYVEPRQDGLHLLLHVGFCFQWDSAKATSPGLPIVKIDREHYWMREGGENYQWIEEDDPYSHTSMWHILMDQIGHDTRTQVGYQDSTVFSCIDDEGVLIEGRITYD